MLRPESATCVFGSWATISSRSWSDSPPRSCPPCATERRDGRRRGAPIHHGEHDEDSIRSSRAAPRRGNRRAPRHGGGPGAPGPDRSAQRSGGQLALLAGVKPGAPEHAGTPIVRADGSLDAGPGDESVAFILALYPVADPHARFRYVVGRQDDGSGFDAKRLIAAHHGYFSSEAQMAEASVTRIVAAREARALPPGWVAQPARDANGPAAITDAFVQAYQQAGGSVERVHFPGARHGFIGQPSA